jgi:hypothetical protein
MCRSQRSPSKDISRTGSVDQLDSFPVPCQQNGVISHHISTTNRMNPNLVLGTLSRFSRSTVPRYHLRFGAARFR